MEEVLEEITNLTKHGCQEFVITGIHVTSYGKDLGDVTLIDLLEEIAKIPEVRESVWDLWNLDLSQRIHWTAFLRWKVFAHIFICPCRVDVILS